MEDNTNTVDNTAIIEELQALNKGIVAVNSSQKELTEYIILRDRKADEEKAQNDKVQAEADQAKSEADQLQSKQDQEQAKADQEITETQTDLLSDINDSLQLSNQIQTFNVLIFGIICGLLFIKIFLDRMVK